MSPSASDPSQAFAISRLDSESMTHVPMGIFRAVERPTYDDLTRAQVASAVETGGGPATDDDLSALLHGNDTWSVLVDPSVTSADETRQDAD